MFPLGSWIEEAYFYPLSTLKAEGQQQCCQIVVALSSRVQEFDAVSRHDKFVCIMSALHIGHEAVIASQQGSDVKADCLRNSLGFRSSPDADLEA